MSQQELRSKLQQELHKLKSGEGDADWLKEGVHWLLQELLELEFTQFVGAERYERTSKRQGYRNGHRPRNFHTRVGTLTLLTTSAMPEPRCRKGPEPRSMPVSLWKRKRIWLSLTR